MTWHNFGPHISVAQKKAQAEKLIQRLKQERPDIQPVCLAGRSIAQSFWGQAWCRHLETYADHENRLERGRSYVRHRAVCHLEASAGRLRAIVAGSEGEPYEVGVTVRPLSKERWKTIKAASAGRIGSMLALLSGQFPQDIMVQVADPEKGLFPRLGELKFSCTCPDWAQMCKHVAATLYGFGHRLDQAPELLFLLRGVEPAELVNLESLAESATTGSAPSLSDGALADIFGIELDLGRPSPRTTAPQVARATRKDEPPGQKVATKRAPTRLPMAASKRASAFRNPEHPKGREISALRQSLKMTVAEFAGALGVSPATVSRWEKLRAPGLHQKSKDTLNALAEKQTP